MEKNEAPSNSPGGSPIKLNDCLEDLLKLVLQSSANGTLEFNHGLSSQFCSSLLKNDDNHHHQIPPSSNELFEGVPQYPLHKRLSSALEQCIISGTFISSSDDVVTTSLCDDDSINEKKDYWNELVSQKGFELIEMLKRIKWEVHVQEPYFSQLKDGKKTVEGRCAVGDYNRIESGDLIFFNKCLMLEVQDVRRYSSFLEMLGTENLEDVLPGVLTVEEGEQIYRNFYTKEKEQFNGVLGICVGRPVCQPYIVLSDIISGLGYRGIQKLLGIRQTVGTIPEALPPPSSTLISSFLSPHNTNVKGCSLTEGARALTKHVNRCSSKYWGKVEGNDFAKKPACYGCHNPHHWPLSMVECAYCPISQCCIRSTAS